MSNFNSFVTPQKPAAFGPQFNNQIGQQHTSTSLQLGQGTVSQPLFGAQSSSTNAFGQQQPLFGHAAGNTSTGIFGQPKLTSQPFSFGSSQPNQLNAAGIVTQSQKPFPQPENAQCKNSMIVANLDIFQRLLASWNPENPACEFKV